MKPGRKYGKIKNEAFFALLGPGISPAFPRKPAALPALEMECIKLEPTKRIYENESFCFEFTGHVLDCQPDKKGWLVVLDRTAFFPEGGGQPADTGLLGQAHVLDVHIRENVIYHLTDAPLTPGQEVKGQVDSARRIDHMEQHTGEHILSGILHSLYGVENVGFGISADNVRLDANLELSAEQLAAAEEAANAAIRADSPVQVLYPTDQELAAMTYRSKKELEGQVRIVAIPGSDVCACCGTHLARTGQVGIIKILSAEKYKGGTRLSLACGGRAWKVLTHDHDQVSQISALLSAKPDQVAQAVQRQGEELAAQKQRCALAETHWFESLAGQVKPGEKQVMLAENLSPDSLRRLCLALSEKTDAPCAVFSPGGSGLAYALAWAGQDVRPLGKALNEALSGRGGGKPVLVQGSIAETDFEKVRAFFETL